MFTIFKEEKVITTGILVFLGLSILVRLLLAGFYHTMIKETDNMATTNNRLLKQCKVKFANCYQLNGGVSNIPVFVDKFLNRLAFGHLSFDAWYHLSGQCMLFSIVFAGVGICKGIMGGRMLGEILPFYIVSFLGMYLYFSLSAMVDIKGKRRILKTNLIDYLENHLSGRRFRPLMPLLPLPPSVPSAPLLSMPHTVSFSSGNALCFRCGSGRSLPG